ncbi:MAG: hypothetical protein H7276_05475 [Caulobacter sp.]|nr:hypothetical protein [Vitreoscilla sp.]
MPLADARFADEAEAEAMLRPAAVTDEHGRLLPQWAPLDESLRLVAPPRKKKSALVS